MGSSLFSDRFVPRLIDVDMRPLEHQGQRMLFVSNRNRMSDRGVCVPMALAVVLTFLDGRRTAQEIQEEILRQQGVRLELSVLEQLLHALDGVYVLDTERYRERKQVFIKSFLDSPVRPPICAGGVYSTDPKELVCQLDGLYTMQGGPGKPLDARRDERELRAILSPHIDYRRGRHSFAWGFKELAERSDATVFVIVATSHYSLSRFILTAKDFRTPLGIAKTNKEFVDLISDVYGQSCFDDEIAHQPEHSIELEVVLLQHVLGSRRNFTIVPLLVGSFSDAVDGRQDPSTIPEVKRMIEALRSAEESCCEKVCYIVSGDLAHIGPRFGDSWRIDQDRSDWCRQRDADLLGRLASGSPDDLFKFIADEEDGRRICGFPPLYVALSTIGPTTGRLLCHDQFVDPAGEEIVSFASMEWKSD